jgi:hypothetical protein
MTKPPLHSLVLLVVAILLGATALAAAEAARPVTVNYVSAEAVYLDAGRADGVAAGARFRLLRGAETIAEVEVDFVAEHSASCKVLSLVQPPRTGDRAVPIVGPAPGEAPAATAPAPAAEPRVPERPAPYVMPPRVEKRVWAKTSGSAAVGYRTFSVQSGPTSKESNGRLSLRLSEIAGKALEVRVRARVRQIDRQGYGRSVATRQSSDRLYELSLAYDPPAGRFSFQLGRLGAGPFTALGYLDGALGQIRLGRRFYVGAFAGTRPDLTDLGLATAGSKYGAFLRYATPRDAQPRFAEIVLGAASERARGGNVSRDYVTLESRFGNGSRWWLFERAEIDLNRDWRKAAAGQSSQVTNAALSGSVRLSPGWRASLSYDQRRNYLTWETRPLPEEVFLRYFRESGRVNLDWETRGGWNASVGVGLERARDLDQPTNSASLTLLKSGVFGTRLLLGGDASYYSGGSAEGWVASLRASWAFRGGHDLGLAIGGSESKFPDSGFSAPRHNQWLRLSTTVQLPFRMFLYGEYELSTGDDFEGDRAFLELAYRF